MNNGEKECNRSHQIQPPKQKWKTIRLTQQKIGEESAKVTVNEENYTNNLEPFTASATA